MRSTPSFIKWAFTSLWGVLLIPVLVDFLEKWLDRNGAYDHPAEWITQTLAGLGQLPGVYPAALVLTGLVGGVWLDTMLRWFDGSRRTALVDLGAEVRNMGHMVRDRQNGFHNEWPGNISNLKASLLSLHVRLTKRGIWSPGETLQGRADGARILVEYLETVGTLLREQQFAEAKEKATELKASLKT